MTLKLRPPFSFPFFAKEKNKLKQVLPKRAVENYCIANLGDEQINVNNVTSENVRNVNVKPRNSNKV